VDGSELVEMLSGEAFTIRAIEVFVVAVCTGLLAS
jgi:hypothetical protein